MEKNNYLGKFIVIEGLDGSGHTTQAKLLRDFFINKGSDVVLTKEPTDESETGKRIRDVLRGGGEISPFHFQELFADDRKWHLDNIVIPALKEGKIVISDRYCFSSFAYGSADGVVLNDLLEMNKEFLLPDLTFILGVNPEVCLERIEKRGEPKELFEKKEKLAKVWQEYKKFPELFENVKIINGEKPVEEVFEEIKRSFF